MVLANVCYDRPPRFEKSAFYTEHSTAAFVCTSGIDARCGNLNLGLSTDLGRCVNEWRLPVLGQKCLTFGSELNDVIDRFIEVLAFD